MIPTPPTCSACRRPVPLNPEELALLHAIKSGIAMPVPTSVEERKLVREMRRLGYVELQRGHCALTDHGLARLEQEVIY
jgi:hypothetical protein